MKLEYECLPCALNTFVRMIESSELSDIEKSQAIRSYLYTLSDEDFSQPPPELGGKLHQKIREIMKDPDPYKEAKDHYNRLMMEKYDELAEFINTSRNKFKTALKLSLVANVIDFATQDNIDIRNIFFKALDIKISIDNSNALLSEIKKSNTILYIGDNAGEIILDKLLLKTIYDNYNNNLYFAVRGAPTINDITREDAEFANIDEVAAIIDTGNDYPGILLNACSDEFIEIFNKADIIISKGQGNFESLTAAYKNIYFLLMVKCNPVARFLDAQKGSFVVAKRELLKEKQLA